MTEAIDALHPAVRYHLANTLRWDALRPLQEAAIAPILAGEDCLLLAPTAGGKTEAAVVPLLSRMAEEGWQDTSVLYVCPLRALLNNLQPRLNSYAAWLGRSAEVWHGDVDQPARQRILRERPDILLTTPESIEAMLVSTKVDPRVMFSGLRAIVVDEIHAFAGDDRGWHLLAVLERLTRLVGHPVQRIGLSATVGNPEDLLAWLQGGATARPRRVIAPAAASASADVDVTLDYVGSVVNAAKVIAALHEGEKRLVFVESRRRAEELGAALRERGINTFLSHSSLSASERRRSEAAFADSTDTVIVATSTLELGIDVGDLDRVIQIDSPARVSSFLQRIGRSGRRMGSTRNCLFLCTDENSVLQAAGLLERWSSGWVEPVTAPPSPRHIAAQQIMALCLQENRVGVNTWRDWWGELPLLDEHADEILAFLRREGYLESDGDFMFIGPQAERKFGRRYFSDLTAVFSAAPEFTVLSGREEVGTIEDAVLTEESAGPRIILLGGRSWQVTHIDWARRRCQVEPTALSGKARWGFSRGGLSFDITRAMRDVVLGVDPLGVRLTNRARDVLSRLREVHAHHVHRDGTAISRTGRDELRWWTWAGSAANRTLQASLPGAVAEQQRADDRSLRLRPDASRDEIIDAIANAMITQPSVNGASVAGLKFADALPPDLATATIAQRLEDQPHAKDVLSEPIVFLNE
ncbi:DEAD/DEAH box helicase [Phytoactinopolyspora mesophila]|uniref:DEAD/DEAH box helicase n=1 Tax=Phytoactinopolyspora mesophila TaxID=2650750 RepID=A0A7K3MAT7_9ACTN|nr:DEAD/DEAH box helicase [Phytoactinopolyspora mesophila]NDL60403.1 DEAD/DEAH box helicase [Phytoactinopolyspora mesophila]